MGFLSADESEISGKITPKVFDDLEFALKKKLMPFSSNAHLILFCKYPA
jgi:hypothetical protein